MFPKARDKQFSNLIQAISRTIGEPDSRLLVNPRDDGVRAGAAPVRQRVSTRLLLFRNWLGNPKFQVCQLLEFVFDHISQHDGPFLVSLFNCSFRAPELYLTRARCQFEDLELRHTKNEPAIPRKRYRH